MLSAATIMFILIVVTLSHLSLTTSFWRWYHAHFIDMKTEVQLDEMCRSQSGKELRCKFWAVRVKLLFSLYLCL